MRARIALSLILGLCACGPGSPGGPTLSTSMKPEEPKDPLASDDIMAREQRASKASVKHILVGWEELSDSYPGEIDPRAASRSRAQARELVEQLYERAVAGEPFEALMLQYSEDAGSAKTGAAYEVYAGSNHVFEFRRMGMRLELGEVGKVRTHFGWHIMKRVK